MEKQIDVNEVELNGVKYVRKDSLNEKAQKVDGMDYCIIRTHSAGVFAGYLGKREGREATVYNARRLWYWSGAASLSQLANEGVKNPDECKFPAEVSKVILTEIIEIIPATEEARQSIKNVKEWRND